MKDKRLKGLMNTQTTEVKKTNTYTYYNEF